MCCFFKSAEEMYAQSSRLESGLEGLDISATEYFVNSVQGPGIPSTGVGGTLARALWEGRVGHDGSITDEAGACLGSVLCPALNKRP